MDSSSPTDSHVHSGLAFEGQSFLGIAAARAYRIVGERLRHDTELPAHIHVEPQQRPSADGDDFELLHDGDVACFQKPLTDVLLRGSAHAPRGPVASLDTGVRVGRVDKRVRAVGDRQLRVRADGALEESPPRPFTHMPLAWDRAYGGRDREAEELLVPNRDEIARTRGFDVATIASLGAISYPRNRLGRGFWIDVERSRLDGQRLPNLVDPMDHPTVERLLARDPADWIDRPAAAGYAPIDQLTFPRCMFWGLRPQWSHATRPVRELALGGLLAADLEREGVLALTDARAFNSAPAGLAVCRLQGNERVTLQNLHREHELLEFDLPGERPRLLIEPPNTRTFELEATLQTVLIEPDEDRVTLTWTGSMPVAAVFPEPMCQEMRHGAVWDG